MLNVVAKSHTQSGATSYRRNLSEAMCAKIFYQIMIAMQFYHQLNISHRDIKLENILVDTSHPDLPTKIIDFGFATQTENANDKLTTFCGTPAYMAPELCSRSSYHGPSADMWAAGVVFYTILFGTQPFKARTEADLFKKITHGNLTFPKSTHSDFNKAERGQLKLDSLEELDEVKNAN